MVDPRNLEGHRAKYEQIKATRPPGEVGTLYVGGGNALEVGFYEREIIQRHAKLEGAYVVDLGCGIGRLTRYIVNTPVRRYLGVDIIPEIMAEASAAAIDRPEFRFALVDKCEIPEDDGQADLVCGFSLITHLLFEQAFDYFRETKRVLVPGGSAVFSFLDLGLPMHRELFRRHAAHHRKGQDLLAFADKQIVSFLAEAAGLNVIEFVDASTPIPNNASGEIMLDGRPAPAAIVFGQSLIYLESAT